MVSTSEAFSEKNKMAKKEDSPPQRIVLEYNFDNLFRTPEMNLLRYVETDGKEMGYTDQKDLVYKGGRGLSREDWKLFSACVFGIMRAETSKGIYEVVNKPTIKFAGPADGGLRRVVRLELEQERKK